MTSSLRPDESIQKLLISTTSKLVGEYENEAFLITNAHSHFASESGRVRGTESPVSRNAYMIAFRTEAPPEKRSSVVIPDYSGVGEVFCAYLSVLYGKRFDSHGLVEGSGFFQTPDLTTYNHISNHRYNFNSYEPRTCFQVPLNLNAVESIIPLLLSSDLDVDAVRKLLAASKFYMRALQNAEIDPEIAYLHLITSAEILASFFTYERDEIIAPSILELFNSIEKNMPDGAKVVRQLQGNFRSIKRCFVESICNLLDDEFFDEQQGIMFLSKDRIRNSIGAAYDLRSKYVHVGATFGGLVRPNERAEELRGGRPVVPDKEFAKVLEKAPSFHGLERVVRYCILQVMAKNGLETLMSYRERA
ncbi:hypothetical protein KY912_004398 [Vibrio vulnificus]|nr:hypothetical protein [Vibrio vulnificus]